MCSARVTACRRRLQRALEKESPEERDLFYAAMWYKRLKDHPELAKDRVRRQPLLVSATLDTRPGYLSMPWLARGN